MPREKEGFRDQLAALRERFPLREAISLSECCEALGICYKTALYDDSLPKRKVGSKYIVPLVALARWMA